MHTIKYSMDLHGYLLVHFAIDPFYFPSHLLLWDVSPFHLCQFSMNSFFPHIYMNLIMEYSHCVFVIVPIMLSSPYGSTIIALVYLLSRHLFVLSPRADFNHTNTLPSVPLCPQIRSFVCDNFGQKPLVPGGASPGPTLSLLDKGQLE